MIALLSNILQQKHRDAGMYLSEDVDFLYLMQVGKVDPLETFSIHAMPENIRAEADKHVTDPRQIILNIE
jgi:hypothetical protein